MEDWFPSLFQVHVRIAYLCEFSLNLSLRLFVDNHCPWKAKCLSLQVLSKLGPNLTSSVVLEVLDMGLHDETEKIDCLFNVKALIDEMLIFELQEVHKER
ncbi:hypothetical protein HN51_004482 [Arachis hypogaea]